MVHAAHRSYYRRLFVKLENVSLVDLEKKIFFLQSRLIDIGIVNGLTHPETLKCSQELDVLITQFQILIQKQ